MEGKKRWRKIEQKRTRRTVRFRIWFTRQNACRLSLSGVKFMSADKLVRFSSSLWRLNLLFGGKKGIFLKFEFFIWYFFFCSLPAVWWIWEGFCNVSFSYLKMRTGSLWRRKKREEKDLQEIWQKGQTSVWKCEESPRSLWSEKTDPLG